ncbi:Smr/MutS family protein [Changchengzhania lutea]|uniref:Smr/MutS family protein n=1 Tax=Changchengzhania lutea TaxID=2049305 RepID=UPI00115F0984|nr:Smr/MutS family protein [Changchengzhania lutea]
MTFKIGDSVSVLDEDFSGLIRQIKSETVTIETKDGFLLDFEAHELVLNNQNSQMQSEIFSFDPIEEVINEKEQPKRKNQARVKPKERSEPTMEVDLHINQLVKSPRRMSNHDMLTLQLDTAKRQLEYAIKNRIQKIVFIHGVGEGILKIELEYLFGRYDNLKFYDANYQKYGSGATEVYIYQSSK